MLRHSSQKMEVCKERNSGALATQKLAAKDPDSVLSTESSEKENRTRTFEENVALLVKYKEVYGNVDVPQNYKGDPKLGKFVNKMRVMHSKSRLSCEKVKKLDRIGFQWISSRSATTDRWEEQYKRLKDFWRKNGTCNVPSDKHGFTAMSKWCARQRQLFAQGKLRPDREARLRSLGFQWNAVEDTKRAHGTNNRPSSVEGSAHLDQKHMVQYNIPLNDNSSKDRRLNTNQKGHQMDGLMDKPQNGALSSPANSATKKPGKKKRTKVLGGMNVSPPRRNSPSLGDEIYQQKTEITTGSEQRLSMKRAHSGVDAARPIKKRKLKISRRGAEGESEKGSLQSLITGRLTVGTKIRRCYVVGGWFEGIIVAHAKENYIVRFSEGDDEEMSDEETKVAAVAYQLNGLPDLPRPRVGDSVRKHYDEGWYEGKITEQNETESNVLFEDGEIECMTDDELQVCVAAFRMHNAPCTCLDFYSLGKPSTKRPAVGAKVRKCCKKGGWLTGKIAYQDEKVSHVSYSVGNDVEEMSDGELERAALAYDAHTASKQNNNPGACTKASRRYSKDWNNGEITTHSEELSHVLSEDGEAEAELTDEELQTTPEPYNLPALKKKLGKDELHQIVIQPRNEKNVLSDKIVPVVPTTDKKESSSNDMTMEEAAVAVPTTPARLISDESEHSMQIDDSSEAVSSSKTAQSSQVKSSGKGQKSQPKAKRTLVGRKLRKRFEDGWFNGTVISTDSDKTVVKFEDGEEEHLSDMEELRIAIKAHKLHRASGVERPAPGTKIRKRFVEGWYEGAVIATLDEQKSYILYADGDEEYMSDEDVCVAQLAYKMHHSAKKKKNDG